MEVRELRVGNWFEFDGSNYRIQDGENIDGAFDFQPIPLTEEWMLKLGYKRLDKYSYVNGSWFIHYRVKKGGFIYNKRTKLDYVHQLQNLHFALTGSEL